MKMCLRNNKSNYDLIVLLLVKMNCTKHSYYPINGSIMTLRREFLATAAALSVAGCSQPAGSELESSLSADASIVRQASEDTPLTIQFELRNEGSKTLVVSSEDAIPFVVFPRLSGPVGDAILLPPRRSEVTADVSASQTDGCWKFVTPEGNDPEIIIEMDANRLSLDPESKHTVRHKIYYDAIDDRCFPSGSYREEHPIRLEESEADQRPSVTVEPVLTVGEDGTSKIEIKGSL